jgi:hypothetical protein
VFIGSTIKATSKNVIPAKAEILMRQIILHLEPVLSDTGAPEVNMFKT